MSTRAHSCARNPDDPKHQQAKPTTRLSVMLPELEAVGVFRLESHGWNAAAEIPAVAELAQFVGDLVPAHLNLVERRSVKDGKTSRFVVPVLDLQIGTARLREIVAEKSGTAAPAIAASSAPALEAPAASEPDAVDGFALLFPRVTEAASLDDLAAVWDDARRDNLVGPEAANTPRAQEFVEAFKVRAKAIKTDTPAADGDGIVDAVVVEDSPTAGDTPPAGDDADAVWQQILTVCGQQGMGLPDVEDDFASQMGGLSSAEASAAELQTYLDQVTAREAEGVSA